ncbi:MAG: VTC domain-containing protein [Proteobacteria bacterium]|jgi:SPX domain protein involved in polyphosphate accumulation|nr:VTC domain-containing protein [Pseudomonadota bacterium]MBT5951268.1 VTC domain-containing protein [Betaproteobacteria bacterium]
MKGDKVLSNARYELKFNAKSSRYCDVINTIENDNAFYYRPYEPRIVNNIYFDTCDLDAFQQNVSGATSRSKLRLRWYGDTANLKSGALELKLRRNRYGWKLQDTVKLGCGLLDFDYGELARLLIAQVDSEMQLQLLHSPIPTLINTYKRDYFVSADSKVRVTVDQGMRFFDQRFSNRVSLDREGMSPELIVVEYKSAVEDAADLERAIRNVRLVRTRNSKYVIGVSSILGL